MSKLPKPPSEEDLPEELPILDVPTGSSPANGRSSRGMLGIVIAAVLGSITAFGLFFAFKSQILPSETDPDSAKQQASDPAPAPKIVQNEPARQDPVRNASETGPGESTDSSPENDQNPANSPDFQSPAVASAADSDSANSPFPGLNPDLNPGITTESNHSFGNPAEIGQESSELYPRPAQDAVAQATRDVDSVFLPQIRNAKTREEKLALVNVLKKASLSEPAGSATRFVLLERAHQLAVDAPDRALTDELVSAITSGYDVAAFDYQLFAVEEWDRMKMPDLEGPAEQQLHRLLAREAASLGDLAYERKDFKTAAAMYALASKRRDRADDKVIADLFDKKRTAARTKESRHSLASSLLKALEAAPDDPEKNLEAGMACVQTGLWDEGLTCLSRSSDESLKNFAAEQLKLRAEPDTLLQAGDQSWDAVRQLGRRHVVWLKELAVADYESAFTELTTLQLQKVKLRIEQVGPVSCVRPVQVQHFSFEPDQISLISQALIVQNRMGHFCNGQLHGKKDLGVGIRGASVELNGRGGMIVCPQTEHLVPGDSPFTLSLWISTDRSQEAVIAGRMYRHRPSIAPEFQLKMLASGHCEAMLAPEHGNVISVQSRDPVPQGQWVHLAMTWDVESLKLYLDGRETASLRVTIPYAQRVLANRAWISIGGADLPNSNTTRFAGRVDEFRIYDQALSPLQIFHVYLEDQSPVE